MKVKSLSHVRRFATPWTAAHQAPPSMGFSRQEYWSGVPLHPIHLGCPKALVLGALLHALNSHWSSLLHMAMYMFWKKRWQPTPEFLPANPHGQRSLMCYIWSTGSQRVGHDLENEQQQQCTCLSAILSNHPTLAFSH